MFEIVKMILGKIADFVVWVCKTITDLFVGLFLRKSGESVEDAEKRLFEERVARMEKQKESQEKLQTNVKANPKLMIPLLLAPICLAIILVKVFKK